MLKPLSLSISLAVALGACSLSFAGGHGKSLPSAQAAAVAPSSQSMPSAQSIGDGCGDTCAPAKKHCNLLSKFSMPKCSYTYEYVLKKKKVWTWASPFGHKAGGCGSAACDSCGTTLPSGQSWGSGQNLGSGQSSYGASQIPASYSAPQGVMAPADAPAAPAAEPAAAPAVPVIPPAPAVPTPPTASTGGLNLLPAGN
jgi:hypothetical protein